MGLARLSRRGRPNEYGAWTLGSLAQDAVSGFTLNALPIDLARASYIARAVQVWALTGSVTFSYVGEVPDGESAPDDITVSFDDSATSDMYWGNPAAGLLFPGANELLISTGKLEQKIDWTSGDGLGVAGLVMKVGFPGLFTLTDFYNFSSSQELASLWKQDGQYWLNTGLLSISGSSPGFSDANVFAAPYVADGVDSGIDYTIMGVAQTLWLNGSAWSASGSVQLVGKQFWTYGGLYDASTGALA